MKIIFHRKENHGILSELGEKNAERVTTIRSSLNENDLIERRRYDVHTFMRIVKLRKIKLPGLRNDSKKFVQPLPAPELLNIFDKPFLLFAYCLFL